MDELETRAVWEIDDLEIRQDGRRISGSFRYGSTAIRSDRGRVRKERIGKRAFSYAIDGEGRTAELDLLVGHDFDKAYGESANRYAGSFRRRGRYDVHG